MATKQPSATLSTEYKLPDGAVLFCRKPTNAIRRVLVEQPELQVRFLMEIIGAACITKMVLPAGYAGYEEVREMDFSAEEPKPDVWKRLDELTLGDTQAFVEAFQENNLPTREMIESVIEAVKAGKK